MVLAFLLGVGLTVVCFCLGVMVALGTLAAIEAVQSE